MTDEGAKALAEAMKELAGAIRSISSPAALGSGVHVYHHGLPSGSSLPSMPTRYPWEPPFFHLHSSVVSTSGGNT